ncbi:MAG: TlpA disulfide reductase family protein, partial [Planctomycetota bacterium]
MNRSLLSALIFAGLSLGLSVFRLHAQDDLVGTWQMVLSQEHIVIRCRFELQRSEDCWTAELMNGEERIPTIARVRDEQIELEIPHYDSTIRLGVVRTEDGTPIGKGAWRKRRGLDEWIQMDARAKPNKRDNGSVEAGRQFAGRWEVKFSASEDPAVGVFRVTNDGRLEGTFLTTTGDYRFLSGTAEGSRMYLSCFDGAHAFAFQADLNDVGQLEGDFWSANTWHGTFTATRNEHASLPDSFRQTLINQEVKLSEFEFPDVNGRPINLDAPTFKGKPRLIYIFGSWCPNCHDAAAYLSKLEKEYAGRGLSI